MNDRIAIQPSYCIRSGDAAACGDGHVFDGIKFMLICPCGSPGAWMSDSALETHMRRVEESRPADFGSVMTGHMKVVNALTAMFDGMDRKARRAV